MQHCVVEQLVLVCDTVIRQVVLGCDVVGLVVPFM